MKTKNKGLLLGLCLCLCLGLLGACAKQDPQQEKTTPQETIAPVEQPGMAQMENPIKDVGGAEGFLPLGIVMRAAQDVQDIRYSLIGEDVAQIHFVLDDAQYTLRGSRKQTDIAGVYEALRDAQQDTTFEVNGMETLIRVDTAQSGGQLATWTWADATFTLWTPSSVEAEYMTSVAMDCAMGSGVQ